MQPKLKNHRLSKRTVFSAFMILIAIPVTIMLGFLLFDDRKYYIVSLLIVIYTMIPFFMVFESRKPQARELVIIAVICALGVAGRIAFFWLPQFKPVVAIVIISGVCFGAESGFLVGALTGFISNFFFGQGPWTPWQMFCFGIIGFLAGIFFKKGILHKKKIPLCIYGGIATLVIYGGIINFGSLMIATTKFSWKALMATYISGLPFDLIHSAATIFFLFAASNPLIDNLDRIKIKYGILEP